MTVIASLFLVMKSRLILCQSLVPAGNGAEYESAIPSAASRMTITGVLALFNFSVRA